MLDVDFQLSLESRKKQSPGGVLQNGSPKDFNENLNNNQYIRWTLFKIKNDVHEVCEAFQNSYSVWHL